ncbi:hypothetical protein CAOG_03382 [Capsaspora owczarzaki ATCC 30864]|uniref:hypothetical protein n=1 Tax=Capsaspora owczarzaki (strain ATCC 30864) TaxID=595528 RepID=UPI0003526BA7|nr:hypothetical protein CAOG_03382 [Capsaspora owczarzaki ATCC 30864]|eukprot:XP_004364221.2 hypothetical protein CAOG_03382 [Capsaspora owczarzaki ATCC 30864]
MEATGSQSPRSGETAAISTTPPPVTTMTTTMTTTATATATATASAPSLDQSEAVFAPPSSLSTRMTSDPDAAPLPSTDDASSSPSSSSASSIARSTRALIASAHLSLNRASASTTPTTTTTTKTTTSATRAPNATSRSTNPGLSSSNAATTSTAAVGAAALNNTTDNSFSTMHPSRPSSSVSLATFGSASASQVPLLSLSRRELAQRALELNRRSQEVLKQQLAKVEVAQARNKDQQRGIKIATNSERANWRAVQRKIAIRRQLLAQGMDASSAARLAASGASVEDGSNAQGDVKRGRKPNVLPRRSASFFVDDEDQSPPPNPDAHARHQAALEATAPGMKLHLWSDAERVQLSKGVRQLNQELILKPLLAAHKQLTEDLEASNSPELLAAARAARAASSASSASLPLPLTDSATQRHVDEAFVPVPIPALNGELPAPHAAPLPAVGSVTTESSSPLAEPPLQPNPSTQAALARWRSNRASAISVPSNDNPAQRYQELVQQAHRIYDQLMEVTQRIQGIQDIPNEELEQNLVGLDWERIARSFVPGRTAAECTIQWVNNDHPRINKGPWTKEEDIALLKQANLRKKRDWEAIAHAVNTNRTPGQYLRRFQRSLNSLMLHSKWTVEEDDMLREAIRLYGERNWQAIAARLPGRTGQQCLHRWHKTLNPSIKRGKWEPEEDALLFIAVDTFGSRNWIKVQACVPHRTDVQCRERWVNVLDPSLLHRPWAPKEDENLATAVEQFGTGKWARIATEMAPRTDNQCWRRWKFLHHDEMTQYRHERIQKKSVLVTNFVGREHERSAITAADVELPAASRPGLNGNGAGKRRSQDIDEGQDEAGLGDLANAEESDSDEFDGAVVSRQAKSKGRRRTGAGASSEAAAVAAAATTTTTTSSKGPVQYARLDPTNNSKSGLLLALQAQAAAAAAATALKASGVLGDARPPANAEVAAQLLLQAQDTVQATRPQALEQAATQFTAMVEEYNAQVDALQQDNVVTTTSIKRPRSQKPGPRKRQALAPSAKSSSSQDAAGSAASAISAIRLRNMRRLPPNAATLSMYHRLVTSIGDSHGDGDAPAPPPLSQATIASPAFQQLANRFNSAFLWPSLLAQLSPADADASTSAHSAFSAPQMRNPDAPVVSMLVEAASDSSEQS